jgi:hypothetical protein
VKQLRGAKARQFYGALNKLSEELSVEFAQLAKLPSENGFRTFQNVFLLFEADISRQDEPALRSLLSEIKRKAEALDRPLDKVHQHLEKMQFKKGWHQFYDLDVVAVGLLPLPLVARLRKELLAIIDALGRMAMPRKGRRTQPGLDVLILNLEFNARCAGGGFTVHRKEGVKGTLIQALDRLRTRLLADPDLKHLADFIPSRHSIAAYEHIVRDARKSAALLASRQ